jgi:hypothetical protein
MLGLWTARADAAASVMGDAEMGVGSVSGGEAGSIQDAL